MLTNIAPQVSDADPLAVPALAVDRRASGKRHQSVLLIGRVLMADGAAAGTPVCLVHDISANGLMARFASPPEVGQALVIEIRGLPPVAGTVRWVRGHKAGVQFVEAQDLDQVFHLRRPDGTVARPPRFPVQLPAQLRLDGRRLAAEMLDVSAGGAKLALPADAVARGQTGALHQPQLDQPVFGTVCWVAGDRAGFRFATPLPLATLTRLLGG
mgnify:CR=1 FL=1